MQFFKYREYNKVFIQVSHYSSNDRLAVLLFDRDEGPVATLTVNISDERNVKSNEAFIDTNNVPDALEFITENDLGALTGRIGYSGFCHYPMVEFNRKLFDMVYKFKR